MANVTRLNNSIGALLELSRLEARSWPARRDWNDLSDIAAAGLAALPPHQRELVRVDLPDDLPAVNVDYEQWTRVIQHLLENAVLYAGGGGGRRAGGTQVGRRPAHVGRRPRSGRAARGEGA